MLGDQQVSLCSAAGTVIQVPLDWFCREDQAYIRRQVSEQNSRSSSLQTEIENVAAQAGAFAPDGSAVCSSAKRSGPPVRPWQRILTDCDIFCLYDGLERYFQIYDHERRHQALDYRTPYEVYQESVSLAT
ncbi:MAG: hypothetical protein KJ000_33295 [Pirellulaceae bacterium]|nr:hypothetical protein [Pirellulaceae bacterium]